MYTVSQLFIYPVKSLGGFACRKAELTDRGFRYDRRWMLVDANNRFLTQREYPLMSLMQTAIENDQLILFDKNNRADQVIVPLQPAPGNEFKVMVWDDTCIAQHVSIAADEWCSAKLSIPCRLVYMPDTAHRLVDQRYAHNEEITSFSDGYPLLIIGQASLEDLNSRLEKPLPMNRFRPNIVFTGGQPYDEDLIEHAVINGIDMFGVKLSARCAITTVDQDNATKAKEPLKTLASYRMRNNKVYFGQNILHKQTGSISVGDSMQVISRKKPVAFNT